MIKTYGLILGCIAGAAVLAACSSTSSSDTSTIDPSSVASPTIPSAALVRQTTPDAPHPSAKPTDPEKLTQVVITPSAPAGSAPGAPALTNPANLKATVCGSAPNSSGGTWNVTALGNTDCSTIMPIAQQFGSFAGDGKQYVISNWVCGSATVAGYVATCTYNGQTFGLTQKS